jgi:hypothetical protein
MIKNIVITIMGVALIISFNINMAEPVVQECVKEPYEQNQMVGGCVMQKSGGKWIRTCG